MTASHLCWSGSAPPLIADVVGAFLPFHSAHFFGVLIYSIVFQRVSLASLDLLSSFFYFIDINSFSPPSTSHGLFILT